MGTFPLLPIVLAAGRGTRMKSALPKVLHRVGQMSMLGHVLGACRAAGCASPAVVIGPDMDDVRAEALLRAPDTTVFLQHEQLGTAHAVLAAADALSRHDGDVVVLYGDTPLLEPATLGRLHDALDAGVGVAVLGFTPVDPRAYGRLVTDAGGDLIAIREYKDATEAERRITLCSGGVLGFRCRDVVGLLRRIGNSNAQGEHYLTDAVAIARGDGLKAAIVMCPEHEVLGIDARDQLAVAEAIFQDRARRRAMAAGATLIAPSTVWFSHDTAVGRDVTIEPNVVLGPGVVIEDDVLIMAHCHITGARIRKGARVGPFARLRPGADLGPGVRIGNFVEVKNATLGAAAKANHLAYIGDGEIGEAANIGAGTIFCNYDGFAKHRTEVGPGAFVGANAALVAPVKVGAGAYIGSGSVITKDVPANALAVVRGDLAVRQGWAGKFRTMMARKTRPKPA